MKEEEKNLSCEHVSEVTQIFASLLKSINDYQSVTSFHLEITNTFYWVGKFEKTESMNTEAWLAIFMVKFCLQWISLVEPHPIFQVVIY